MKKWFYVMLMVTIFFWAPVGKTALSEENKEDHSYHGADAIFQAQEIAIFWAILKGDDDEHSLVFINIVSAGKTVSPFRKFSLQAMDPFSKEKKWVFTDKVFEQNNLIKLNRASFRNMMERRFFFYMKDEPALDSRPDMTVYYMSIPDTAPEFLDESGLLSYFKGAIARLAKTRKGVPSVQK
jgi:hypothetical protein